MTYFINAILSLFILLSTPAFAGSGHDHGHSHAPITKIEAENIAIKSLTQLVERNTIASSWKSVSVHKSEKKKFGDQIEWLIIFINKKISDSEKQTLYIFLSLEGQYLAANFTGA